MSKVRRTISFPTEFEPDFLNTFCATRVYRMYELIRAFAIQFLLQGCTQRAEDFTMYQA